jgi:hypothetical protein
LNPVATPQPTRSRSRFVTSFARPIVDLSVGAFLHPIRKACKSMAMAMAMAMAMGER